MPDNVVEIKIVGTGIDETGAQFEGFSDDAVAALSQISQTAGVAAGELNILQSVMKADAAAGIELATTLKQVAESNATFSSSMRQAAADAAIASAATEEVTAAGEQLAPAMDEAAGATTRLMSAQTQARYSAMLLGRELGVPIPRALSAIASQASLLAPILSMAFPVIAAVALGEVLYTLYEKMNPLIAAEKALAEETKANDREFAQLGKELEHLQIEELTAKFGAVAGARMTAFYSQSDLKEDETRIGYLTDLIARTKKNTPQIGLGDLNPGVAVANYNQRKADLLDEQRYQDEIDGLRAKAVVASQAASTDKAKEAKDAGRAPTAAAAGKAAAEAARKWASEQAAIDRDIEKEEKEHFKLLAASWDAYIKEGQAISKEQLEQEDKNWREGRELQEAHDRQVAEANRKAVEAAKKAYEDQRKATEYASAGKIGGLEGQRSDVETKKDESSSPIDKIKYLEQLKAIDAQIIQEKIDQQARLLQLDSLNDPSKVSDDQAKLAAMQAASQRTMAKDTEEIYKEVQQTVTGVVSAIDDDLTKNVNKWMLGHETFGKMMNGVWLDLATTAVTSIEKIIEKQLEQMAIQEVMKALGISADPNAAAAKQKTANAGEAQSYAALAGGTEFATALASSGGNIPYALAMSTVALGIGEGYASISAAGGADLPNHNTFGFLHPREMVLPQSHADVIRGLAGGNNSRTSSMRDFNYNAPKGQNLSPRKLQSMMTAAHRNSNN